MGADELTEAPAGTVVAPERTAPGALWAIWRSGSCWWAASLVAGAVAYLAIGVPTALVASPVFGRTVAPRWWDHVVLVASSLLIGMIWASRTPAGPAAADGGDVAEDADRRRSVLGGVLTYLAVGCPVCNKLALLALGAGGAMTWFAPVQPVLGAIAVALLAVTLRRRLRSTGAMACGT